MSLAAFQLPDGANTMIIGELREMGEPLLFVGGNCAIQGFDYQGEDKFWTVSSLVGGRGREEVGCD